MRQQANKKLIILMISILAFVVALPIAYFGFQYVKDARSGASSENPPKAVQVLNPVDNSIDIAWTTDGSSAGKVKYTLANGTALVAEDDRGASYKGTSHIAKLRGIGPKSKVDYVIVSDNKEYTKGSFTTFSTVLTEPASVYGTARSEAGATLSDNIVRGFLIEKGTGAKVRATSIGTVTAPNGTWSIDSGNFRTESGGKIATFNNYLLVVELLDAAGIPISRVVSPNMSSTQSTSLVAGKLDDPIAVAATYTSATVRTTDTPTPTTPQAGNPSITASPRPITTSPTPTLTTTATVSNAQIVNVLDGSFAVVWETDIPTNSYISYTINGANKTSAFDKRSNEKLSRSLRTHFVEVIDTNSAAGAKYEITLINNGVAATEKISFTKIAMDTPPSVDSIRLKFRETGNFLDQILLAEVPGKSTKIATPPTISAKAIMDLSGLRKIGATSAQYSLANTDTLQFSMLGGVLNNASTINTMSIDDMRDATAISLQTTPKDSTAFKIIYINISEGEVLNKRNPNFYGEGFEPDSDLQIQIEKQ